MTDNNLSSFNSLDVSNNPRADHADITNARTLFGDPFGDVDYGDAEDGDAYGDADYGDVINDSTLSAFEEISGDPLGDINLTPRQRNAAILAGTAVGTAGLTLAARRALAKRRAQQAYVNKRLRGQRNKQTVREQRMMRQMAGKIDRHKKVPFFQVTGARMNSSPIDSMEGFIADMLKYNLDRQASDTPFFQETAIGVFAAGVWTATATGVVANRFYTALVLQLGINYLNAAPGTIFQVTASLPTIAGTLTVAATPWIFTIEKGYDVRFLFYPWQLVSNRPLPVIGQYSNANPIVVSVTGLPAASSVNLVVPGSLHPWTIAMRNALIK